ncbi:MAG: NUDIX hydrolase [Myxococcota bacterium]|nr:NUDIX hydrolase [Myxococcota bacterium]
MHRKALLELLARYESENPGEVDVVERIRQLVKSREDCFERSCLEGHITASSWILSEGYSRFLLTRHRKLGRWLQLGGHADGDSDVVRVALREAREESGLTRFSCVSAEGSEWKPSYPPLPLDIDVHRIPARGQEPEHEHHDIRFLLLAAPGQTIRMSEESTDLAWFELADLPSLGVDRSLLRLAQKTRKAIDSGLLPLS